MSEQVSILAIGCGSLEMRGVESYLLNLYSNLEHETMRMDILTPGICRNPFFYDLTETYKDKVIELGIGKNKLKKVFIFHSKLYRYLTLHAYDVAYVNTGNVLFMACTIFAAYRAQVPIRIVHSHNSDIVTWKKMLLRHITRPIIRVCANSFFACSKLAAEHAFPKSCLKSTLIIPNGIDLEKYAFDQNCRAELRTKYNLGSCFVLGHVGAFIPQKNHKFLVDIFAEVYEKHPNTRLVLIGEGTGMAQIKKEVINKGLEKVVLFIGKSLDVEKWLCAFDLFLLPSRFEGLPVSAVEAQVSGLPCIVSSEITQEVKISNKISFLSIQDGTTMWVEEIIQHIGERRLPCVLTDVMRRFDVKLTAKEFQNYILNLSKKIKRGEEI